MIHYSDDELSWHSLKPEGEIRTHLERCVMCRERYEHVQDIDDALAEAGTWMFHADLRTGGDPVRARLQEVASRLAQEIAEAKEALDPLISEPLRFVWEDISRTPIHSTAGAVHVLCDAAHASCEREPVHARNLADAALAIATSLSAEEHYLGAKVHQLVGLAQKERGNAFRYLGDFRAALLALDDAKRAYDRAGVSPWDEAALLYTRGVVLYRSARPEDAEKCADQSAALFLSVSDRTRYLHACMLRATVRYWQQDFAGARDDYRGLLACAEEEGDEVLVARLSSAAANCELDLGDSKSAEPALVAALHVFKNARIATEIARVRWALARIPLIEGRFAVATALLRASKLECERLGLTNDAALVTLDLAEVLVATGTNLQEVQKLCRELFKVFKAAGMINEALTALAYLREAVRARTITREKIRHVRRFLARLEEQPAIRFEPPEK